MPEQDDPITLDQIIFPSASNDIARFHREAARSRLSLNSRLCSVAHDADFVGGVADHYGLPLVANERCGSWYVKPQRKQGSVYFKSTDGHFGQWTFSCRRLNLHLLKLVAEQHGCIIIDSTRRGKSMPDALSKTIPIWIAVLNRILFPEIENSHHLCTSEDVTSKSEHAQIEARLPALVQDVVALDLDLPSIRAYLQKPLRPFWITQTSMMDEIPHDDDTYPIVLCTASGRDAASDFAGFDYVQGAADDAEAWAHGLTPTVFWVHAEKLLGCPEDDLPDLIQNLISEEVATTRSNDPVLLKPASQLYIGIEPARGHGDGGFDAVVFCAVPKDVDAEQNHSGRLVLPCPPGKLGSRALRTILPRMIPFLDAAITNAKQPKILVACPSGEDHSMGVALSILCLYVSDTGSLQPRSRAPVMTKDFIRKRLSWITICIPEANPSRATLQSVNAFLLGGE